MVLRVAMSADGSTPVRRNELGELPGLTEAVSKQISRFSGARLIHGVSVLSNNEINMRYVDSIVAPTRRLDGFSHSLDPKRTLRRAALDVRK